MPVSSEISVTDPYYPNGVTTSFGFDFKAASAAEVVAVDGDGNTISTTLYSVTLDEDEGGSLTFGTAPTAEAYPVLYVMSDPALTQPSNFDNAGPSFNPAGVTRAFDRAATRDLKQQREIDRSLKVPFGEPGLEVGSLVGADGKVLGVVAGKIAPVANDVVGAEQARAAAEAASDAAEGSRATAQSAASVALAASGAAEDALAQVTIASIAHDIFPVGARDFVPRGAVGNGAITAGSGGTNGTFTLAFSGGNFSVNPTGTFTVAGGVLTAISITGPGLYMGASPTAPTLSFAASTGLTGAAATLTVGYLIGGGEFYFTPSDDDGFVSQYQNVANAATLIEENFDPLSTAAAVATAMREFPDYRETFGSLEFTAGAFISAPGNAFGSNDVPTKNCYLREFTATREGSGTHRMFLVNAAAQITWSQTFTADAGGDDTHEVVDVPMMAGSRLHYENLTGDGILWENVGEEPYFPVATWSGVIGDEVTLVTDNPVSVCLSYKVSYTPSTAKIAEIDAALVALGEASDATRDDRIVGVEGIVSAFDLTTTATFSQNGNQQAISDARTFSAASGSNERYDVLYYDTVAGTFGVTAGTARADDAPEFIPAMANATRLPVFNVRVTSSAISIVPVWNVLNGEDRSLSLSLEEERNRSRRYLRKTIQRIRRGQSLHIVGLGDSITAIQSDMPGTGTPNGTLRDRAMGSGTPNTYLRDNIGDDVVDALPTYTAVQLGRADDGAGSVHSRIGFNWELVTALEAIGYTIGTDLTYDNFGIGGLSSHSAATGGSLTTWGTNAVALGADLAIIGFGMNELGDPNTEANIVTLINSFKAAGADVIVMGVPRPRTLSVPDWIYTHRALERAARFAGAAFVPTLPLYDDRTIGVMGMTGGDVCTANAINHPGLLEHRVMGAALTKLVLD